MLKIQVWDHDDLFADDKIGTTTIDLEDRFFSNKWKRLPHKPIETRKLYIKTSRRPQGYIRLWVEIFENSLNIDPHDITPKPPAQF